MTVIRLGCTLVLGYLATHLAAAHLHVRPAAAVVLVALGATALWLSQVTDVLWTNRPSQHNARERAMEQRMTDLHHALVPEPQPVVVREPARPEPLPVEGETVRVAPYVLTAARRLPDADTRFALLRALPPAAVPAARHRAQEVTTG